MNPIAILFLALVACHATLAAENFKISTSFQEQIASLEEILQGVVALQKQGGIQTTRDAVAAIELTLSLAPDVDEFNKLKIQQLLQLLKKPEYATVLNKALKRLPEFPGILHGIREFLNSSEAQPIWDAIDPVTEPMIGAALTFSGAVMEAGQKFMVTYNEQVEELRKRVKEPEVQHSWEKFLALPEVHRLHQMFGEYGFDPNDLRQLHKDLQSAAVAIQG